MLFDRNCFVSPGNLNVALFVTWAAVVPAFGEVTGISFGGPMVQPVENCILQKQPAEIEAIIPNNAPLADGPHPAGAGVSHYPFQLIANIRG